MSKIIKIQKTEENHRLEDFPMSFDKKMSILSRQGLKETV